MSGEGRNRTGDTWFSAVCSTDWATSPRAHSLPSPAVTMRKVVIIGARSTRRRTRGVDMGPSAIRYAGLEDRLDAWGTTASTGVTSARRLPRRSRRRLARPLPQGDQGDVRAGRPPRRRGCEEGRDADRSRWRSLCSPSKRLAGSRPCGTGARCSGSTLTATSTRRRPRRAATCTDAPRRCARPGGRCVRQRRVASALRGAGASRARRRALADDGERELVKELGVFVATMTDLDRRGVETVVREALDERVEVRRSSTSRSTWTWSTRRWRLASEPPSAARALLSRGAPRDGAGRGGRRPHLGRGLGVNLILDRENATAELAVEFAASAFGARIL